MTVRALQLVASAALLVSAWWVAPSTTRTLPELARPIAGPLILPFVWSGVARAQRQGRTDELIARGRELLRLLPNWVDGHLYLAQSLAFDRSAPTLDAEIDQLLASLALLDEAIEMCPAHTAEFLVTQAFLVDFKTGRDPELARAYRNRRGIDPLASADGFLARAAAASSHRQARIGRAYLAARMIGPALRDGETERAIATLDRACGLLGEVEALHREADEPEAAADALAHRTALMKLRSYLNGDSGISAAGLRADPYLEGIADDLPVR